MSFSIATANFEGGVSDTITLGFLTQCHATRTRTSLIAHVNVRTVGGAVCVLWSKRPVDVPYGDCEGGVGLCKRRTFYRRWLAVMSTVFYRRWPIETLSRNASHHSL
jgi:hypothetical protein